MEKKIVKGRYFSKKIIRRIISEKSLGGKNLIEAHLKLKEVEEGLGMNSSTGLFGASVSFDIGNVGKFIICIDKTLPNNTSANKKVCHNYIPIWRNGKFLDTTLVEHSQMPVHDHDYGTKWVQEKNQWDIEEDDHFWIMGVHIGPANYTPILRLIFDSFFGPKYEDYHCYIEEDVELVPGWICPKCKQENHPNALECYYCKEKKPEP